MDVARSDTVGHARALDDPVSTDPGTRAAVRRPLSRELPVLVGIALVLTLFVRLFVAQAFYIPSGSMQPTLEVDDRVLVSRLAYRFGDVQRGDVVVFDGRGSFAPIEPVDKPNLPARAAQAIGTTLGISPSERDYVKRVIGLPGDRVVCCESGRLTVNGAPLDEPYVMPGDAASNQPFDVLVPTGRLWVMGDHRGNSADSRYHITDAHQGTVPESKVVGRAFTVVFPFGRFGLLHVPSAFSPLALPAAPYAAGVVGALPLTLVRRRRRAGRR